MTEMNGFQSKKISVETLGEYLSHAREELHWSFSDVRRLTQIPEKFLAALEGGDYQFLPADVYVKGFLKSLAAVYRVEGNVLLEQFEKERGLARKILTGSIASEPRKTFNLPRFVITPKTLTFTVVVLLAGVSLAYLAWQIRSVSAAPELSVTYPAQDTTIASRSMLLRGTTEPGSQVHVNAQEILVDENGEFRQVLNFVEGTNQLVIKSENKFGKSSTLKRTVIVMPQPLSTSTEQTLFEGRLSVEITIGPQDAWLQVKADGKIAQDGVVPAGQTRAYTADSELLLSTGNAGATRVRYNGKDLGTLGRQGELLSNIRFSK